MTGILLMKVYRVRMASALESTEKGTDVIRLTNIGCVGWVRMPFTQQTILYIPLWGSLPGPHKILGVNETVFLVKENN